MMFFLFLLITCCLILASWGFYKQSLIGISIYFIGCVFWFIHHVDFGTLNIQL